MTRDWRLLLLPLIILTLFVAAYFIFRINHQPEPKPIPEPESIQPDTMDNTGVQPRWYMQFSVQGQKSTYYTEAAQAPASSSSQGYFLGSGAVHPLSPLNAGGEARQPIIPFGTRLYLSQPIEIQGNSYDSLVVNDTGDVYYGLWRQYPYWVDVYAGTTNYYSQKDALKSGVDVIDYYWYEPWI